MTDPTSNSRGLAERAEAWKADLKRHTADVLYNATTPEKEAIILIDDLLAALRSTQAREQELGQEIVNLSGGYSRMTQWRDEQFARAEAAEARAETLQQERDQLERELYGTNRVSVALEAERDAAEAARDALAVALKKAKTFIEYARYVLEPGLAKFPDQFPKQEDADVVLALIKAALDAVGGPQETP